MTAVPLDLETVPLHKFHRVFMRAVEHDESHHVQAFEPVRSEALAARCSCGARLELAGEVIAARRIGREIRGLLEAVPTDLADTVACMKKIVATQWDIIVEHVPAAHLPYMQERINKAVKS